MSDQVRPLPSATGRCRTTTRLSAMGSVPPLAQPFRDIPGETARPNRTVMLGSQALDRSDITEGKPGIPLTLIFAIVDATAEGAPIAGAAVEIWHCDADGVFSEYASKFSPDSATTTYLRGVQTSDRAGRVTFKTIYPGWSGVRAPHVYVRVYDRATPRKAVQIGFPDAVSAAVYGDAERYVKGQNPTRNAADPVFGDAPGHGTHGGGLEFQIAAVAGNNASGYVVMLEIPVMRFG
jgi:protocatechuate 3,4-dioxygenase beta subunit